MKKKFFIYCPSCPDRRLEATFLKSALIRKGYSPVNRCDQADYLIVFTCAFIERTEKESLNSIKFFQNKAKKGSKIVVGGCLPAINPNELKKLNVSCVFTPSSFQKFLTEYWNLDIRECGGVLEEIPLVWKALYKISSNGLNHHLLQKGIQHFRWSFRFTGRPYLIKISDGCNGACSYCGIKKAIGDLKSVPDGKVISTFQHAIKIGHRNFVLVSKDWGAYGIDIGSNIPSLIHKISYSARRDRISLSFSSMLNPEWFVKYSNKMIHLFKKTIHKIGPIEVSFQSGSPRLLSLMGRPVKDIKKLEVTIKNFRNELPNVRFHACFMIGFPSESEYDFEQTVKLATIVRFDKLIFYKYEDRPNTLSSFLKPKVPQNIIVKRMGYLKYYFKRIPLSFPND